MPLSFELFDNKIFFTIINPSLYFPNRFISLSRTPILICDLTLSLKPKPPSITEERKEESYSKDANETERRFSLSASIHLLSEVNLLEFSHRFKIIWE